MKIPTGNVLNKELKVTTWSISNIINKISLKVSVGLLWTIYYPKICYCACVCLFYVSVLLGSFCALCVYSPQRPEEGVTLEVGTVVVCHPVVLGAEPGPPREQPGSSNEGASLCVS